MAKPSMSDELYQGVANIADDISAKFEESVWGREVTEHGGAVEWPQAQEPEQSFGSSTHSREVMPEREQAQDIDLDR